MISAKSLLSLLVFFFAFSASAKGDWQKAMSLESYDYGLAVLSGKVPLPEELGGYQIKNRFSERSLNEARKFIIASFFAAGFEEVITETFDPRRDSRLADAMNLYVKIPGETHPDEVVIISAHYDSYGRLVPGANDNGSGSMGVIALAQAMKAAGIKPARTLVFALWDVEERVNDSGMYEGSVIGIERMLAKSERPVFMVNFDMIGYSPSGLPFLCIDPTRFDAVKELAQNVAREMHLSAEIWNGYFSDHETAIERGIPALSVFENPRDSLGRNVRYYPHYHTRNDVHDKVNIPYAVQLATYGGALAMAAATDPNLYLDTPASRKLFEKAQAKANRRIFAKVKEIVLKKCTGIFN